ncbi:MAG: PorV/PorQ family protein [candidate division Zixibacteria bacterium]|jgi:long-subunit fatty acid transport protein|nr:PorV/PorQ family protein [candidate division Zixibacteria bacterium]
MVRTTTRRPLGCSAPVRAALALTAITLVLVVLLTPADARAQAKVGTTGAQFLELGVSARAMGMAEAYTAVVDDISSIYYNPAALVQMYGREGMLTYIDLPADIDYGFGAVGFPLESIGGVLGFSMAALTTGDIIERTYEQGTEVGTGRVFTANDFLFSVGYGRYLTDRFSIGFNVKYIGEFFHEYSASGWAADVGTVYDTGFRGFKIAMVITNFGPDLTMISTSYPLPINFRFGGAINLLENVDHMVTFAAEGSHPSDNLEKYNVGLEYTFKDRFVLRGGSRFNYDEDGFTAGGGIRWPLGEESEIRVDYAFQDFGVLTEVHRFTMGFAF